MDNSLFTLTIRDNSSPRVINIDPDESDNKPWALLVQIGSSCLVYDFGTGQFLPVSYSEYMRYRSNYNSLEVRHRPTENRWIVIPIGGRRPKRIDEADYLFDKKRQQQFAEITSSPLKRFVDTSALLDELARD